MWLVAGVLSWEAFAVAVVDQIGFGEKEDLDWGRLELQNSCSVPLGIERRFDHQARPEFCCCPKHRFVGRGTKTTRPRERREQRRATECIPHGLLDRVLREARDSELVRDLRSDSRLPNSREPVDEDQRIEHTRCLPPSSMTGGGP